MSFWYCPVTQIDFSDIMDDHSEDDDRDYSFNQWSNYDKLFLLCHLRGYCWCCLTSEEIKTNRNCRMVQLQVYFRISNTRIDETLDATQLHFSWIHCQVLHGIFPFKIDPSFIQFIHWISFICPLFCSTNYHIWLEIIGLARKRHSVAVSVISD